MLRLDDPEPTEPAYRNQKRRRGWPAITSAPTTPSNSTASFLLERGAAVIVALLIVTDVFERAPMRFAAPGRPGSDPPHT